VRLRRAGNPRDAGCAIWPASHGSEEVSTSIANGQSCLPGVAITRSYAVGAPSGHSKLAASV